MVLGHCVTAHFELEEDSVIDSKLHLLHAVLPLGASVITPDATHAVGLSAAFFEPETLPMLWHRFCSTHVCWDLEGMLCSQK